MLTASAEIQPIEFQNQQAVPIRSLAFLLVDWSPHPVSISMIKRYPPPSSPLAQDASEREWLVGLIRKYYFLRHVLYAYAY